MTHRRRWSWTTDRDLELLRGRVMLVLVLAYGGWLKLRYPEGTAAYLRTLAVPLAGVPLVLASGALEFGAGLALLVGWRTRAAALVLLLYLMPVTWFTHVAPGRAATDLAVQDVELLQALKNLAVMGGLVLLARSGPGRHSLDGA
jgi:putative oxidoreductase